MCPEQFRNWNEQDMAECDEYLDYPNETLEQMVKLWSAFVRGIAR